MIDYIERTDRIISKIKDINNKQSEKLKPLILELARHLEEGIKSKRPEIIISLKVILLKDTLRPRGQDDITPKLIAQLIHKIKSDHFSTISESWINKTLPNKYKQDRVVVKQVSRLKSEDVSDSDLFRLRDSFQDRIRKMVNIGQPSKDIKLKEKVSDLERYSWKCHAAQELAKICIKMEKEHKLKHIDEFCKKACSSIRMARDERYATTESQYQAIIVASEFTRSLSKVTEEVIEYIGRWDIDDNEKHCRECLDMDDCRSRKCNHLCHGTAKQLTTKGVKWAIEHNPKLKELHTRLKRLQTDDDDMCAYMKIIFKNPLMRLNMADKKTLMAKHIDKDDCDQCLMFTTEHPDFFSIDI